MLKNKRIWLITAGILIILAVLVVVLGRLQIIPLFHTSKPLTASSYTKGEPSQASTPETTPTNSTADNTKQGSQDSGTTDAAANAVLIAPTGDFVSNHHPSLSGSPTPNTLTSVCTTTPGATCKITFTKDGVTKSLPSEATDAGGVAYWNNWTLQSIGLSAGSWQIKAIAALHGQTKTTPDALTLTVAP